MATAGTTFPSTVRAARRAAAAAAEAARMAGENAAGVREKAAQAARAAYRAADLDTRVFGELRVIEHPLPAHLQRRRVEVELVTWEPADEGWDPGRHRVR